MYKLILGFTALVIAGCAAFFSVKGIATLFSGAFLGVIIMAGSLELGKLVATTFLHRYWDKTSALLKAYLLIAVLLLMGITSMGTYGFLSAAYQSNAAALENITLKINTIEQQKQTINLQVNQLQERVVTLNEARKQQEKNLAAVTSNSTTKYKLVYQDAERAGKEITDIQKKIDDLQASQIEKDQEINTLKTSTLEVSDIGAFKFIAENFNQPLNVVVKWFILAIVLVFDPLAVALVLSYNTIVFKKETLKVLDVETPTVQQAESLVEEVPKVTENLTAKITENTTQVIEESVVQAEQAPEVLIQEPVKSKTRVVFSARD